MASTGETGRLRPLSADDIRAIQLELLDLFAAYATEHSLTWFVYAGTLLGAARHQGYIPWDDDLDVAMPRRDYQRWLELAKSQPIPNTRLTAPGDRDNPLPFTKLSMEGTRLLEPFDPWPQIGVNIDVFPVDNWPRVETWLRRLLGVATSLVWLRVIPAGWGRDAARRLAIRVVRGGIRRLPVSMFARVMDRAAAMTRHSSRGGVLVWGVRDSVPWSDYLPTSTLKFEGRDVPAPGEWERVLVSIYGDWRQPPPESERATSHQFEAYSTRA